MTSEVGGGAGPHPHRSTGGRPTISRLTHVHTCPAPLAFRSDLLGRLSDRNERCGDTGTKGDGMYLARRLALGAMATVGILAGAWMPAGVAVSGAAAVAPDTPTGLVTARERLCTVATVAWDVPAAPEPASYRFEARNLTASDPRVGPDWLLSDVSTWQPWTSRYVPPLPGDPRPSMPFGHNGVPGAFEIGVTAISSDGSPSATAWALVPPCDQDLTGYAPATSPRDAGCGSSGLVDLELQLPVWPPVARYEISARKLPADSEVPADWVLSDPSGWQPWSVPSNVTSERFSRGGLVGAFEVGVTAIGLQGARSETSWAFLTPCIPTGVTASVEWLSRDQIRVDFAPLQGEEALVSKFQLIPVNGDGWLEDKTATSVVLPAHLMDLTTGELGQIVVKGIYGSSEAFSLSADLSLRPS